MKADVNLELFLGSGVMVLKKHIELLKAVDETKSITKAAQAVGISYKNAWDSLDILNNKSDLPLISRASGNKKNSGSELTQYGKKMIEIYENLLQNQREFLNKMCVDLEISTDQIVNFSRLGLNLSARNQLNCEIVAIKSGAVSSTISAKLNNGKILNATITLESEKSLNLAVGKRVVFIFKAPAVMLSNFSDELKISEENELSCEVISVKVGAVNAEVVLSLNENQTISSIITKESVMSLKIGVGDRLKAIVKSSDIIIGV
ncbi:TOBE domain-containing protein [Campylobacter gastrosuis]|uniref:TOBE domain-containing protein n=1 Tax=Campylobacter gastrosuis TaxID=2974576 RepID=A0ABT7HLE0_9BACT|nr:TOBE domain-containing protein [Campylobacter gastrosuis]MDL0087816.1 TOBE domain-containing protein [Campylobacter gastrosuis]MDL0088027.1 TOBE domain-containing protein [Campylobacter gastrosuis]